jgi:hypothetical protein
MSTTIAIMSCAFVSLLGLSYLTTNGFSFCVTPDMPTPAGYCPFRLFAFFSLSLSTSQPATNEEKKVLWGFYHLVICPKY